MPIQDYGQPDVEYLARAICKARKADPDEQVPSTGYKNAKLVPLWWFHQDFAMNYLACVQAEIELRVSRE